MSYHVTPCHVISHESCSILLQWFLEKLGHEGLNNLLLAYPDKSAYAQCIAAYCGGPGQEVKVHILLCGRSE